VQLSSRWSLQRNARGQATAIISASNDITAVRQAEEALSQAQAQLAHVMRVTMLGELMASIAHEINQPLAAIAAHGGASLRWLDRRPPNLAEVSVGLREITRDAERASEVIRRIRALSKKSDAVQQRLEIRGVIEEALALVEREILGKKITLLRSLMDEPLIINGDKVQLQQVIINLVINAAHAIDTRSDGPRIITVSSDRIGNRSAMVSVSDTGPGLSENDLPLLFDAFFTTRRDGMGLGLSICKSIVESNGGVIYARNNKAQGAQFRFLLPLAAAL
jgi:C4-dicarboxylate-specific signal transduction histidine kinase